MKICEIVVCRCVQVFFFREEENNQFVFGQLAEVDLSSQHLSHSDIMTAARQWRSERGVWSVSSSSSVVRKEWCHLQLINFHFEEFSGQGCDSSQGQNAHSAARLFRHVRWFRSSRRAIFSPALRGFAQKLSQVSLSYSSCHMCLSQATFGMEFWAIAIAVWCGLRQWDRHLLGWSNFSVLCELGLPDSLHISHGRALALFGHLNVLQAAVFKSPLLCLPITRQKALGSLCVRL